MAFENTPEFQKLQEELGSIQKNFSNVQKESKVFDRGFFDKFKSEKPFAQANEGDLLRTGQFNVGGKNVTFNQYKGKAGSGGSTFSDYEFILPDGRKTTGSSIAALGHSSTYGMINDVLRKSIGGETEKLSFLGTNASQGFDSNIAEFAKLRGIDPATFQAVNNGESAPTPEQQAANQAALSQQTGLQPTDTAAGIPKYGDELVVDGQRISPQDPNYDTYANQQGLSKDATGTATQPTEDDPTGVNTLVASGQPFNETDAKNFAHAQGEQNYQKYIGGVGGQENPLYIGPTNFQNLQRQYTPYQIERATVRTKDGIYWNPEVNIGEVPRTDPIDLVNDDSTIISNIITDAKNEADALIGGGDDDKAKGDPNITDDIDGINDSIMKMLQNQYGTTAESLYEELYDTPEMKTAQEDVISQKNKLDEFDQQLEELKNDIRAEVEGEASAGYISALATLRGENILKQKRSVQRDYDTSLGVLNGLKEEANNLLQVRASDANTRYNRLFSMLQLQIQQEGTAFNQDMAILNASMNIPSGRTMKIGDMSITGMKENDNLNVVQFTDANRNTYVVGVDKTTGEQKYKTFIGKTASSGSSVTNNYQYQYKEEEAKTKLEQLKNVTDGLGKPVTEAGAIRTAVDEDGETFYYDANKFDTATKADTSGTTLGDIFGINNPKKQDYLLFYSE